MDELLPGVWHWTAYHEGIRQDVHSHLLEGPRALLDPMVPDEGLGWFADERRPERILLTNRHHLRHSDRFVEAFDCPVLCVEAGLHEFDADDPPVQGFAFGDEVAPGVTALEVGAICPDETALHAPAYSLVALADGAIRYGEELSFVPDFLMGDDPEGVKQGLRASFRRLCEQVEFENLVMAHGDPIVGGAREALAAFARAA
jgi:hypothetical protein